MWDGRSRPREAVACLLERGDRLLWIKQRIRGGCIRSIQHSVLTTDGSQFFGQVDRFVLFGALPTLGIESGALLPATLSIRSPGSLCISSKTVPGDSV